MVTTVAPFNLAFQGVYSIHRRRDCHFFFFSDGLLYKIYIFPSAFCQFLFQPAFLWASSRLGLRKRVLFCIPISQGKRTWKIRYPAQTDDLRGRVREMLPPPLFFQSGGYAAYWRAYVYHAQGPAPVLKQSHKSKQRVLDLWSLWGREGKDGFCSLESCSSRTVLSFPRWPPHDHLGYRFLRKYLIPKAPTSILPRRTTAKHRDKFLKGFKWK